ncbi:hypothetical protein BW723_09845 [Polaribacter reichenbachii]|uniref:Uncharacterized protein n=1 Tax=Polaribacter reichenbachii TaxID=996801 RepID=A0A1B8U3E8_9FLAO|nr:hypothetical protein [Polaribacter reichenbachii]APZ46573.1 hypothetical protein BW723_09845 [Polaribacter reichenbachii]AUC17219.1 hypothetical protein BTO17_00295 [Polaribacter reichenbachii]OBY66397.1 hypothetical protein LPB301_06810 [Polaribacter reichenbachii]
MNKTHIIPNNIEERVQVALKYFPQLADIQIEFKLKKNIKKSTMQARPTFDSFFKSKKNRKYLILISKKFKISDQEFSTLDIPDDIFIGWIGHELGHIMDYQDRSRFNLILFGLKYLFSENHIVEAERAADRFAVKHKMEDYILKTKNFILNHAEISEVYKNRMRRYYLSPEEIMFLVEDRDKMADKLEKAL